MGFLRLICFVSFTRMVKQVSNMMAYTAYIIGSVQRLTDRRYGTLSGLKLPVNSAVSSSHDFIGATDFTPVLLYASARALSDQRVQKAGANIAPANGH